MTVTIDRAPPNDGQPLLVDLALRNAAFLFESGAHSTLAALHRCSKDYYFALSPIVYRKVSFKPKKSYALFFLGDDFFLSPDSLGKQVDSAVVSETIFSAERAVLRRILALQHIRHLSIHSLPADSSPLTKAFTSAVNAYSPNYFILPSLQSVQLLPPVADEIRTYIPETYDRPHNPAFLESLISTSRPTKLCLSYPVVPSQSWDEHLELTTIKQYQLVARMNRLIDDGWSSLETFCVHDIVHQVLPSLKGCKNVYHFSSHCVLTDEIGRVEGGEGGGRGAVFVSPGKTSTGIPGPKWNFRSWQIGTAVKNLFPSGANAAAILEKTSWVFVNHKGHILTKLENDDDDDTGVGYMEVGRLIDDAIKGGLPQDLIGRAGFKRELADEVLEKMKFIPGEVQCVSCGRKSLSSFCSTSQRIRIICSYVSYAIGIGHKGSAIVKLQDIL